jgi:hypothetical protein
VVASTKQYKGRVTCPLPKKALGNPLASSRRPILKSKYLFFYQYFFFKGSTIKVNSIPSGHLIYYSENRREISK